MADAAVLHSFASVEFNPAISGVSTTLFEQTLIQSKIPFDIIFDRHLNDLSKYKLLVLADQDALSDEQVRAIRTFVENGGGLVATGTTSLLNDWRLRRRKFALAELFRIDLPPAAGAPNSAVRRTFGKGRVVYIPRIEPAVTPPPALLTYNFANKYWKLPVNYQDLAAAVNWAAGGRLSATVSAPASVTMELTEQKSSSTLLLHLVNFDFRRPVRNIDVSVRLPAGFTISEVTCETPDGNERQAITPAVHGGVASFRIPSLKVYDLALIRLRRV